LTDVFRGPNLTDPRLETTELVLEAQLVNLGRSIYLRIVIVNDRNLDLRYCSASRFFVPDWRGQVEMLLVLQGAEDDVLIRNTSALVADLTRTYLLSVTSAPAVLNQGSASAELGHRIHFGKAMVFKLVYLGSLSLVGLRGAFQILARVRFMVADGSVSGDSSADGRSSTTLILCKCSCSSTSSNTFIIGASRSEHLKLARLLVYLMMKLLESLLLTLIVISLVSLSRDCTW